MRSVDAPSRPQFLHRERALRLRGTAALEQEPTSVPQKTARGNVSRHTERFDTSHA